MSARTPAFILGGTGYVAGELLRLALAHPRLELAAIASDSQPGEPVAKAFPHLAAACGVLAYVSIEDATDRIAKLPRSAVLAVVVLTSACDGPGPEDDAGMDAGEIADSGPFDAGCQDFEEYDPVTMQCVPLV